MEIHMDSVQKSVPLYLRIGCGADFPEADFAIRIADKNKQCHVFPTDSMHNKGMVTQLFLGAENFNAEYASKISEDVRCGFSNIDADLRLIFDAVFDMDFPVEPVCVFLVWIRFGLDADLVHIFSFSLT